MVKELPKRSEVRVEDTWKVEDLYTSVEVWNKDMDLVKELLDKCAACQGKMGTSAENLYQAFFLEDEATRIAGRVYSYAHRCSDVDTKNAENQALVMQAANMLVMMSEKSAFIVPELLAIPEETLDKYFQEKPELEVAERPACDYR